MALMLRSVIASVDIIENVSIFDVIQMALKWHIYEVSKWRKRTRVQIRLMDEKNGFRVDLLTI